MIHFIRHLELTQTIGEHKYSNKTDPLVLSVSHLIAAPTLPWSIKWENTLLVCLSWFTGQQWDWNGQSHLRVSCNNKSKVSLDHRSIGLSNVLIVSRRLLTICDPILENQPYRCITDFEIWLCKVITGVVGQK